MLSEYLTPANADLGEAELHFAPSSLDTHLGSFTASFCFCSGGRQDARLSLGFLWDVLERGNHLCDPFHFL